MKGSLKTFTNAIDDVEKMIIKMAKITEKEISLAVESLVFSTKERTEKVFELDSVVNELDQKIHSSILQLIMIQPPLPNELQALTTMIRISREFERIGDQAVNIANISQFTIIHADSDIYLEIKEMCRLTTSMLTESIDVIKNKNSLQALRITQRDDEVDRYFHQIHKLIVSEMRRDMDQIELLAYFLLIVRYLERSADHVVNVMQQIEKIEFLVE